MEVQILHVPDLDKEGAATVKKALSGVKGVEAVEADLAEKLLTVTFDENQVGLLAIEKRIQKAGYPIAGSRVPNAGERASKRG